MLASYIIIMADAPQLDCRRQSLNVEFSLVGVRSRRCKLQSHNFTGRLTSKCKTAAVVDDAGSGQQ